MLESQMAHSNGSMNPSSIEDYLFKDFKFNPFRRIPMLKKETDNWII